MPKCADCEVKLKPNESKMCASCKQAHVIQDARRDEWQKYLNRPQNNSVQVHRHCDSDYDRNKE